MGWFGRHDIESRRVDVDPDEVQRAADDLQVLVGKLGRILARFLQIGLGVPALEA
jgi:hypothetical protein